MMIPTDPLMLLSYINTQLRDHYSCLTDLAEGLDIDLSEVVTKLENAGYQYSESENRFVRK